MPFSRQTRLALFAWILAFVVVALGAFTRLSDAGLGCPDWPGCYGHLTWPTSSDEIASAEAVFPDAPVDLDKTWPEMVHRYFAGTLGLVILFLAVMTWRQRKDHTDQTEARVEQKDSASERTESAAAPYKLSFALVILVTVQALFGMWTVTLKLWPQVVTAHLLGGFMTLSLLWLLFLRLRRRETKSEPVVLRPQILKRLRQVSLVVLALVVLQISLGGWTSSNYAALACIDLPTCHGEWWPETNFSQGFNLSSEHGPNYLGGLLDNEARTAIHLTHRIGAVVVTVAVLLMSLMLWRTGVKLLRSLATVSVVVLALQVTLGITNILATLPLSVAVAHNGVGALLLLVMVTVCYQLWSGCRAVVNTTVNTTANTAANTAANRTDITTANASTKMNDPHAQAAPRPVMSRGAEI
ncbi:COX15/CtaA family protein [Pseudomaricurvus sp.]|uniref:COX15/CtaA family protein n=1 Tax=Pseudomaricurvus sp. TaxID=2004510 RepID=UPI003F6B5BA0